VSAEWPGGAALLKDGQIIGYCFLRAGEKETGVSEYAVRPDAAVSPAAFLGAAARLLGLPARARLGAAVPGASDAPGKMTESTHVRVRLNRPFTCGGESIADVPALKRLCCDLTWWDTDGF